MTLLFTHPETDIAEILSAEGLTDATASKLALQIAERFGLRIETGYTDCSDPQCGDSTWDHDCDNRPQHRVVGKWVPGYPGEVRA